MAPPKAIPFWPHAPQGLGPLFLLHHAESARSCLCTVTEICGRTRVGLTQSGQYQASLRGCHQGRRSMTSNSPRPHATEGITIMRLAFCISAIAGLLIAGAFFTTLTLADDESGGVPVIYSRRWMARWLEARHGNRRSRGIRMRATRIPSPRRTMRRGSDGSKEQITGQMGEMRGDEQHHAGGRCILRRFAPPQVRHDGSNGRRIST